MSPWNSDPRLTPRGARLSAGAGLLLLAFTFGPLPEPALVSLLVCTSLLVADGFAAGRRSSRCRPRVAIPGRLFAGTNRPLVLLDADASGVLTVSASLDALDAPQTTSADPDQGFTLEVPTRGAHAVRGWTARIGGPLGLVSVRSVLAGPSQLTVLPQPLPEREARALGIVPVEGLAGRRRAGPPHDPCPAGLRAWRDGDPLRAIHARASARRGRPVVREDEPPTQSGVAIELDRGVPAAELEFALAALTRVLLDAEQRRIPLHLTSQGIELSIGPGHPSSMDQALRFVAAAEPTTNPLPPGTDADAVELAHIARLGGLA